MSVDKCKSCAIHMYVHAYTYIMYFINVESPYGDKFMCPNNE